jgi:hypothetical protein
MNKSIQIKIKDESLYEIDDRIIQFSVVFQALERDQEIPLEIEREDVIHIHEFYLMFNF